ncbi:DUF4230 domain-containing protein [Tellurirhabdus rosea]|uniref:DUF4230 domain-containing protein n=1 Tax=Tellurirhabdus rosea TaxID=2674997 RepID=UPI00225A4F1C|nr:DUF4230 domain-containing protein [Tellurirhabdus rosea]
MTRLLNALLRLFLLFIFVMGLIALWEQLRSGSFFRRFTRSEETVHSIVLQEVTALGKLELVRYRFKDVVEHEQMRQWLPNPRAVLIVEGEAVGCLDLTQIKAEDVATQGDTLVVHLPDPELCTYRINHDRSKVYNTEYALFEEAGLVTEAYRQAEVQIRQSALQSGILEQTRENADKILKPFLEKVSGKKVFLVTRPKARLAPLR